MGMACKACPITLKGIIMKRIEGNWHHVQAVDVVVLNDVEMKNSVHFVEQLALFNDDEITTLFDGDVVTKHGAEIELNFD